LPLEAVRTGMAALCFLCAASAWCQSNETLLNIDSFEVTGNTLLPSADVAAALAPFKGRRSMAELKQAAQVVQELYRRAGYGAVVAYVPEQRPADGKVTIAVLEGKVAKVVVTGNRLFSTESIRRALPVLEEGRTPHVRQLDRQVQLANENPARQMAVTLEPGTATGDVDALIAVTERRLWRWWANVDNTGDKQTGDWRVTLGWRHDNVADRDHQLSLQLQSSPSAVKDVLIASATYGVPFYKAGIRLDAYATYSNVDNGTTPTAAGSLSFTGEGSVVGARLTKLLPRWGDFDQRLGIGLDRRDYRNECTIAGLPPGACGAAGESVTANPLSVEFSMQTGGPVPAGAYLALSSNLDLGGRHGEQANFDAVRPGAPLHYRVWRLAGYANPRIGGSNWGLRLRAQAQLGQDALVPGEQFALAGSRAVRGYREREIAGDRGHLGAIEVVTPDLFDGDARALQGDLRLSLFADGGRVSNRLGTECRPSSTRCDLLGYGLGLGWAWRTTQVKLDVARAARDGTITDKGEWRAHFLASWTLE